MTASMILFSYTLCGWNIQIFAAHEGDGSKHWPNVTGGRGLTIPSSRPGLQLPSVTGAIFWAVFRNLHRAFLWILNTWNYLNTSINHRESTFKLGWDTCHLGSLPVGPQIVYLLLPWLSINHYLSMSLIQCAMIECICNRLSAWHWTCLWLHDWYTQYV